MKFRENEDAVSPVIGVILMVAITVILAAVIAAFVFGMGSNVPTTKNVVATASADFSGGVKMIHISYKGGPDHDFVEKITYSINGNSAQPLTSKEPSGTASGTEVIVGASKSVSGTTTGAKDHVVVTAEFKDNSKQVILDVFV